MVQRGVQEDSAALQGRQRAASFVRPLWAEHVVDWSGPRQLRFRMPVVGRFTAPTFGYHVGAELGRRWRRRQPFDVMVVEAVSGYCDERAGRRSLTVLVTFERPPRSPGRVDGPNIARDVESAVSIGAQRARGQTPVL